MSLFGTGRREGVLSVLALCAFALLVHALGVGTGMSDGFEGDLALARGMDIAHRLVAAGELPLWDPTGAGAPIWARGAQVLYPPWWLLGRGQDALWLPALAALHAALACALGYRFLRAHGRSRYAAFVCGATYGLGAHVGALGGNLAELAALAWAPLGLEAFLRIARGERQRHLAAWLGPALAVPFLTGGVLTASCSLLLVMLWLGVYAARERHRRGRLLAIGAVALTLVALLTAPMWLGSLEVPPAPRLPVPQLDLSTALQRIAGPVLLFLAVLGALRRQRNAPTGRWLLLAGAGAAVAVLLPHVPSPWPGPAPWQETPAALWWPVLLALVLLGSNGLDDFLDLPLRRRAATAWTLMLCTLVAPLGFLFGEVDKGFHVQAAVMLSLAALFAFWRKLGILGFKTVVAAAVLVWLAAATLHEQARAVRAPLPMAQLAGLGGAPQTAPLLLAAAPAGESALPLRPPERARLEFELRPGDCDHVDTPLPRPVRDWTEVADLPAHYQARPDPYARATLVREGANWSEYFADLAHGAGALVVADTWAPGWRATVDDAPARVHCADHGARAVLLPPGRHRVRFEYRPAALHLGARLFAGGLGFSILWALVLLVRRWIERRRQRKASGRGRGRGRRSQSASRAPARARPAIAQNAPAPLRS